MSVVPGAMDALQALAACAARSAETQPSLIGFSAHLIAAATKP